MIDLLNFENRDFGSPRNYENGLDCWKSGFDRWKSAFLDQVLIVGNPISFTLERYCKVWEYQNRTRHEKYTQGLILRCFGLMVYMLIGAWGVPKVM